MSHEVPNNPLDPAPATDPDDLLPLHMTADSCADAAATATSRKRSYRRNRKSRLPPDWTAAERAQLAGLSGLDWKREYMRIKRDREWSSSAGPSEGSLAKNARSVTETLSLFTEMASYRPHIYVMKPHKGRGIDRSKTRPSSLRTMKEKIDDDRSHMTSMTAIHHIFYSDPTSSHRAKVKTKGGSEFETWKEAQCKEGQDVVTLTEWMAGLRPQGSEGGKGDKGRICRTSAEWNVSACERMGGCRGKRQ
ncbi:uncharacterized protein MKK02DRAFT_28874 [Dioszegia hungarica]|uniref:Uncharacterized protein n=1 Tax=Dioszegia hungarica TaxID=4972 RepID=A0AA38H888_9TREE|nr:uncharacterized protein MKK02DRAFT_28874 [Dioszegia hungarica]KAI9634209.1 hypothetical protein MKK02DRAFT_28874 [Dioszegia hungarica]